MHDDRFDFRQGRNSAVSPDLLNPSELADATNVRIDTSYGGFTKRTGTRRLHAAAIGTPGPVTGLVQWDWSGGKQLVAIASGNLHHKTSALGAFTQVVPATLFSTTLLQTFAPFRATTAGAALNLYIAGTGFYRWTGAALTLLAPAGLPTDAILIASAQTRMFVRSLAQPKNLYWSKTGDAETYLASGLPTDGGTAMVNVLNGESINALEVIGQSLLIGAEDSVSRFTGSSADNIQIASDTLGLSTEIGPVGAQALKKFETAAALLGANGPHVASEAGVVPIGVKVEPDFLSVLPAFLSSAVVGYHRGRRELWFAVPGVNDSNLNKTVYVYSTRLQAWMGPWTYPFGITSFARYEDANGAENLVAGGSDGFVRLMDNVGDYRDDVLSDNSGGVGVTMTCEPAPHFFDTGARLIKTVSGMDLDADLPVGSGLLVKHSADGGAETSESGFGASVGLGSYRIDMYEQGKRIRIRFVDASSMAPVIYGYSLEAYDMNRR